MVLLGFKGYATFTNTEDKKSDYIVQCPPIPVFLAVWPVYLLHAGYAPRGSHYWMGGCGLFVC